MSINIQIRYSFLYTFSECIYLLQKHIHCTKENQSCQVSTRYRELGNFREGNKRRGRKSSIIHLTLASCFGLMTDSAVVDSALVDAALRKSGLISNGKE